VIVAPGIVAPEESITVPSMVAVVAWAPSAALVAANSITHTMVHIQEKNAVRRGLAKVVMGP
jgi:hypothetical protein